MLVGSCTVLMDIARNEQLVLDMNFYISLGGPVTFKNAKEAKEVAKVIPLDRSLIETDAPYLHHTHIGENEMNLHLLHWLQNKLQH